MTTDTQPPPDGEPTMGPGALSYDRYESVETADDELIVYDTDDDDAWIQSSVFVDLDCPP